MIYRHTEVALGILVSSRTGTCQTFNDLFPRTDRISVNKVPINAFD